MTVSRVLSGKTKVSAEKVKAVQDAAAALGYEVNMIVRSVMSEMRRQRKGYAGTIAFLNSAKDEQAWHKLEYNRQYFEGADRQARNSGFHLDELWTGQPGWTPQRTHDVLKARGISGILVVPGSDPSQYEFDCSGFAMASFGGLAFPFPIHQAIPDYFHNYAICHDELWKLGYRRIGLFLPDYDLKVSAQTILGGFLAAQWKTSMKNRVPVGIGQKNWQECESDFHTWIDKNKPDVIIAAYNKVPEWLAKRGMSAPKDVGLAHPAVAEDVANWSGVDNRRSVLAAAAVDLVTAQILRGEQGFPQEPKTISVTGRWVEGKTTFPQPL
jgi:LacI family transcriptional regulator